MFTVGSRARLTHCALCSPIYPNHGYLTCLGLNFLIWREEIVTIFTLGLDEITHFSQCLERRMTFVKQVAGVK